MTEIQKVLLRLVVEMNEICLEHGISFVLSGGNALGLERNGGFVPWDDDLDMFITADNIKKLDAVMTSLDLPDRAWISGSTYPKYNSPIYRFADTTTTQLVRGRLGDGTPLAQLIEFFAFVPYPNSEEKRRDFDKYLWLYHELEQENFLVSFNHRAKDIIDRDLYLEYEQRIAKEGKDTVLAEIEREHLVYPEDECVYMCARYGGKNYIIKKEWMDNIVFRSYEGHMLPFFADNIEFLSFTEFGYNWNIVPEKGKEVVHGNITNPYLSYQAHIDEVMNLYNQKNLREVQRENKRSTIRRRFDYLDLQEKVALQKRAHLECIVGRLQHRTWAFDYKDLAYYCDVFKDYFFIQFDKQYAKWKLRVEINDDLLETILLKLIYMDRIEDAETLLGLYKEYPKHSYYMGAIQALYRLKVSKYANKLDEAGQLLYRLNNEYDFDGQIEVERTRVWHTVQTDDELDETDIQGILDSLNMPRDAEVQKYIGDYYLRKGNKHKASLKYALAQKGRNGMLHKDMNDNGFFC